MPIMEDGEIESMYQRYMQSGADQGDPEPLQPLSLRNKAIATCAFVGALLAANKLWSWICHLLRP